MWRRLLLAAASLTVLTDATDFDEDTIHVGVLLSFSWNSGWSGMMLASAVHAHLELGKLMDPPMQEFRRANGSLIGHYIPFPDPHPNITKLRLHFKDARTQEIAARSALEFAYGWEDVPPMNAVLGPTSSDQIKTIASIFGVLQMVQVTPAGISNDLTNKRDWPYFFRATAAEGIYGMAFWDYVVYFGWRGGWMLYQDNSYGDNLRSGLQASSETSGRSGDISYNLLPSWNGWDDTSGYEAGVGIIAAEVKANYYRLLMFAISSDSSQGHVVRDVFMKEDITAPHYQYLVPVGSRLNLRERSRLQDHRPETFHGLSHRVDLSDPSVALHLETWTSLKPSDITDRLPDYGTANWDYPPAVGQVTESMLSASPPWESVSFDIHGAFNVLVRSFNRMLNAGLKPSDIHGDLLKDFVLETDFDGMGQHYGFDSNRDVIADLSVDYVSGWDEENRTVWTAFGIRRRLAGSNDLGQFLRVPGSPGPVWATGEQSWVPPIPLAACPWGTKLEIRAETGPSHLRNDDINNVTLGICAPCPGGYFSVSFDSLECDECSGGTISTPGSSSCTVCDIGTFAPAGSAICTKCFPGTFGNVSGMSACRDCPPGQRQESMGEQSCNDCSAGHFASAVRSEKCAQCPPGQVSASAGQSACTPCAPGLFQSELGMESCDGCPRGTFSAEQGQSRCTECDLGFFQQNETSPIPCARCPVGTYAQTEASSACMHCSFGTTLVYGADSSSMCTCPANTFFYEPIVDGVKQTQCVPCNEWMEPCPGGTAPALQKEGYHVIGDGQTAYYCLSKDACPGGLLGSCPTGSSGPGCSKCDEGTHYWDGDNCARCSAGNGFLVAVFPIVFIGVVLGTHWFGNDPIGQQLSAISEGIVLVGLSLSVLFFFSSFEALDVEWKEPVKTLMSLGTLLSTELTNVNFTCSVAWGPAAGMAITSSIPLVVILVCLVFVSLRLASPKKIFNTCGSITYAAYLLLVLHALKPFRYIVHPLADKKSLLFMPSVFEGSDEHARMVVVGFCVIAVYVVPFAAVCLWASLVIVRTRKVTKKRFLLTTFRFLFYKFRPSAYYWGFYILARNAIFALMPSLFPERASISVFLLSGVVTASAVMTGFIWPWRARWMNCVDAGTLGYLSLVLNLAVGWVRKDKDSDGAMATLLVVIAGAAAAIAAFFGARLLFNIVCGGRAAREKMREAAMKERQEAEKELMNYIGVKYDEQLEVANALEALTKETNKTAYSDNKQLAPGLMWISQQPFDIKQAQRIAVQMRQKDYSLQMFFEDCVGVFPELQLYTLTDGLPPTGENRNSSRRPSTVSNSSSGLPGEAEQLRTLGAFFAIYWICRLDMDGKQGLSFGVEADNTHKVRQVPKDMDKKELATMNWGKMTPDQRRAGFFHNFDWGLMSDLFQHSGLMRWGDNGQLQLDSSSDGRLVALLCLTAFHDIMKTSALCPRVAGEPYEGYSVGETIQDHDLALAYILDRHPELLPSFRGLSPEQRRVVRFTQSEMGFNAGWLVQAEGPPGAVLGKIKKAITNGMATDADVAFYFSHWVTDLAGAEPTPFVGTEKFAVKFPPKVLQGLLGCFGVVKELSHENETQVYERYLENRWNEVASQLGPLPKGSGRTAKLRLNCMGQQNAKKLLDAFDTLNADDYHFLVRELSETGLANQIFMEWSASRGPQVGIPCLTYYGPAWCQRAGENHPEMCLKVLADAMRISRGVYDGQESNSASKPEGGGAAPTHYTLQLAALKSVDLLDIKAVLEENEVPDLLQVSKDNSLECTLHIHMTSV